MCRRIAAGYGSSWTDRAQRHIAQTIRHLLVKLDLPRHFPADSPPISFTELAKRTGVSERSIKRIVRYAVICWLLAEPEEGMIAHTAGSRLWCTSPLVQAMASSVSPSQLLNVSAEGTVL